MLMKILLTDLDVGIEMLCILDGQAHKARVHGHCRAEREAFIVAV